MALTARRSASAPSRHADRAERGGKSRPRVASLAKRLGVVALLTAAVSLLVGQPAARRTPLWLFRTPLPADDPVLPQSGTFVRDFVRDYQHAYGAVTVNTMPLVLASPTQAPVPITVKPGHCADFRSDTGFRVPIPADARTTGVGDSPLVVYQPSTGSDWELWQASRTQHGWSACWGGKLDAFTSDGVFPDGYGLSGSGISYLATMITEADVAAGSIDHAIALDLPACNAPPVFPADRTDCSHDPGQPPEGTWWRFPPGLRTPRGLTPFADMVFRAIRTYGLVFTDQAGAVAVQAQTPAPPGHAGADALKASFAGKARYQVLDGLPWDELEAVRPP